MSPQRVIDMRARRVVVDEIKRRDGDRCYAGAVIAQRVNVAVMRSWPLTCAGPLDPHEIIPRSVWKAGWLVASNVRMVCRRHHEWIGDHELEAATLGLHGYSWQRGEALDEQGGD